MWWRIWLCRQQLLPRKAVVSVLPKRQQCKGNRRQKYFQKKPEAKNLTFRKHFLTNVSAIFFWFFIVLDHQEVTKNQVCKDFLKRVSFRSSVVYEKIDIGKKLFWSFLVEKTNIFLLWKKLNSWHLAHQQKKGRWGRWWKPQDARFNEWWVFGQEMYVWKMGISDKKVNHLKRTSDWCQNLHAGPQDSFGITKVEQRRRFFWKHVSPKKQKELRYYPQ